MEGAGHGTDILLLGYAIAAHALARVIEFVQHVLRDDVARPNDADANGDGRPVAAEPSPRPSEHVFAPCSRPGRMSVAMQSSRVKETVDERLRREEARFKDEARGEGPLTWVREVSVGQVAVSQDKHALSTTR